MTTGSGHRAQRADARRNAERLLAAADEAFQQLGTDAPLDKIARDAEVAIGTLYGHFPDRQALIAALLRDRHDALFALGARLLTESTAADALTGWISAVARHAATYRGLADVIAASRGDEASELHADCVELETLTRRIAARARREGELRRGTSTEDLVALMNAAAWIRVHHSPRRAERLVAAALAGLHPA
jgi:AcrR family transcriptional regulator